MAGSMRDILRPCSFLSLFSSSRSEAVRGGAPLPLRSSKYWIMWGIWQVKGEMYGVVWLLDEHVRD